MFVAVLSTIAKTRKQLKCPSTEDQIKKMWYIYTIGYYSAFKKNEIMPFAATWMDLEMIVLSEVSQTDQEKYHMMSLIGRVFKKMIQTNLFTKQKQTYRFIERIYGYQRGSGGGINWEFGIDMSTLLYLK